ncbi:MAG: hypothetical protein JO332_08610 [Planctomycetaceae bacterium]|nr:hypothetical protein [Planctomycetaceae bacterium]
MSESRPPLPWEVKAPMAVLGLLCLEVLRELAVFVLHSPAGVFMLTESGPFGQKYHGNSEYRITDSGTGVGGLLFLAIYVGLIVGLRLRSPLAWVMGLLLTGGAGVVNLLFLLPAFQNLFPAHGAPIADGGPQERIWTIARIALQLSVPALLILAKLRGRLRDWD